MTKKCNNFRYHYINFTHGAERMATKWSGIHGLRVDDIAEITGISQKRVYHILTHELGKTKFVQGG